jgi:hypothetical protein
VRLRLPKILKRLLVVLGVLVVLLVAAFTWLFYWPLEGNVDDVLRLVPADVEFVLRADYGDLQDTGWVQHNVLDDPLVPDLGRQAQRVLDQIHERLAEVQRQVDASVPLVHVDVSSFLEDDVLKGEVCVAGNFWEGSDPDRGPPEWKDLLILKRVSRWARCISALDHGFIRSRVQLGPGVKLSAEGDGIFLFTLQALRRAPHATRIQARVQDPDLSHWYLTRIKDVIAVSNRRSLIDRVRKLADEGGAVDSFASRPGFEIRRRSGHVVAAVNVTPLRVYVAKLLGRYPRLQGLRRFLPPQALEKLSGSLSLEAKDILKAGAPVTYIPGNAEGAARNVYHLPERKIAEGIAQMVPAKNTFAVLSLRCDPQYLFRTIVHDVLTDEERRLWEQNLQRMHSEFHTLDEFFDDLSSRISDEATVAVARLSVKYDHLDYKEWYSAEPDPMPSLGIMVRIREGTNQKELDDFIAKKVPLLGFGRNLDRVSYRGFTYSRARLEDKFLDYKYLAPCFILANNHLVMTTTEDYMHQILDTISEHGKRALADDETFRVTMGALPARGHVGIFVDLEKLTRVPRAVRWDPVDMGAPGTRGLLWDMRNEAVRRAHDDHAEIVRFRRELEAKFPVPRNARQQAAIEKQVDEHWQAWHDRYPTFIEEYRHEIEGWRRLRGFGLVLGARGDAIDTRMALVLREPAATQP